MSTSDSKPTHFSCLALIVGLVVVVGLVALVIWYRMECRDLAADKNFMRKQVELAELQVGEAKTELQMRSLLAEHMINDLARQLRDAPPDVARCQVALLQPLASQAARGQAFIMREPARGAGWLIARHLPAVAVGQEYQLWFISSAGAMSGGTFQPGADGQIVLPFNGANGHETITAATISLEKEGGATQPEGPVVMQGDFFVE